ncbi:MAG TPA: hypothetical protein PLD20_12975 [Blastocatellia bacterium]|nr:hypothetical protein [Blastocatellia bacterium]HMV87196.1 hypothetical protein [Blastocatellia bacterium]HMY70284.1 hypothetical protein [Blastocatellia bacterium]HMZ18841.1 hypothetical protein [Blastocatellia bacterium]HNG31835.1 hypothetical protein [Blastocatellia bacterium]
MAIEQELTFPTLSRGRIMNWAADFFGDRWSFLVGLGGVVPGLIASQWDGLHVAVSALASFAGVLLVQLLRFWLRAKAQNNQVEKDNADRWYQAYLDGQARQERLIGLIIELSGHADQDQRTQIFRQLRDVQNSVPPQK